MMESNTSKQFVLNARVAPPMQREHTQDIDNHQRNEITTTGPGILTIIAAIGIAAYCLHGFVGTLFT